MSDTYEATQYGAILFIHDQTSIVKETGIKYNTTVIEQCRLNSALANYTSSEDCESYGGLGYIIQYNFTALHVAPLFQALADEAIVRHATNNDQFEIKVTIAPLPLTSYEAGLGESEDSTFLFVLVVLSFPMIAGSFGAFIVLERESKAKHLQTVAGVDPTAYWLSSFLWDSINYQIPLWITIALFFLFDMDLLTTNDRDAFSGILAVLFLYGPAATAYTYCLSFAFSSPSVCTMVSIISGFLIGMGGPVGIFIMSIIANDPGSEKPQLEDIANAIAWILRIFNPSFCLGKGVLYVLNMDSLEYIEADPDISAWKSSVVGLEVLFLAIHTVVYLWLAIKLDQWSTNPAVMSWWKRSTGFICCRFLGGHSSDPDIQYETPDDSDVVQEQERVVSGQANDDLIVLDQLCKVYDNGKKAVNNVSLGIPPGQCFGLLGINGAGKVSISTFKVYAMFHSCCFLLSQYLHSFDKKTT
jgi:ATP-binding cassette, subfamily A (ABC1), member 3